MDTTSKVPDTCHARMYLQDAYDRFIAARWAAVQDGNGDSFYPGHHFEHAMNSLRIAVEYLGYNLVPFQADAVAAPVSGPAKDDDTASVGGGEPPVPAANAVEAVS